MSSEAVIEAKNISKVYLLYNKSEDRLKQMLVPRMKRLLAPVLGSMFPVCVRTSRGSASSGRFGMFPSV
ncbi:hypothetical protein V6L77_12140 [Pannonibacter sp. Pt2-lr]